MRHGPGYVSGKQTKSAPSAPARSIHCTASATLRPASPGGCEIGCTTAILKVIGVSPKHDAAELGTAFPGSCFTKKLKIVNRFGSKRRAVYWRAAGELKPSRAAWSRRASAGAPQHRRCPEKSFCELPSSELRADFSARSVIDRRDDHCSWAGSVEDVIHNIYHFARREIDQQQI
jgi:hypothetical protein